MKQQDKNIESTPLKNCRELAELLVQLPKDERLRVEGIIIGIGMRHEGAQRIQDSA